MILHLKVEVFSVSPSRPGEQSYVMARTMGLQGSNAEPMEIEGCGTSPLAALHFLHLELAALAPEAEIHLHVQPHEDA